MKIATFNKIIFATGLLCSAAFAHAQSATTQANGVGQATGGSMTYAPVTGGSIVRYDASTAVAAALAATSPCMGSSSSGVQAANWGISLGSTWKDIECRRSNNSHDMWNDGLRAAAIAELCIDDKMRYAIAVTGGIPYTRDDGVTIRRACPMTEKEWISAGKPLLDPATGAPFTEAQLNPPVRQAPSQAEVAAHVYAAMSPDQRKQVEDAARASAVEQHAEDVKQQASLPNAVTTR